MTADCESFVTDDGLEFCGEPAIGWTVTACLHEHVNRRRICAGCACEIQRWADGSELICTHCDLGEGAHACLVVCHIEWDCGTPVTVIQGVSR